MTFTHRSSQGRRVKATAPTGPSSVTGSSPMPWTSACFFFPQYISPAFASLFNKSKEKHRNRPGLAGTKVNLLVFRCKERADWPLDLAAAPGRTQGSGEKNRVTGSGTSSSLPPTTSHLSHRRRRQWPSRKLSPPRKTTAFVCSVSMCISRSSETFWSFLKISYNITKWWVSVGENQETKPQPDCQIPRKHLGLITTFSAWTFLCSWGIEEALSSG